MKIIIYITALICSLLASPVLATETGQISMTDMGLKVTPSPESTLYEGDTWMITARNNFSLNEAEIKNFVPSRISEELRPYVRLFKVEFTSNSDGICNLYFHITADPTDTIRFVIKESPQDFPIEIMPAESRHGEISLSDLGLRVTTSIDSHLEYGGQWIVTMENKNHLFTAEIERLVPSRITEDLRRCLRLTGVGISDISSEFVVLFFDVTFETTFPVHFIIKQSPQNIPIEILPIGRDNYISTTNYLDNTRSGGRKEITYYNGLGYPSQKIEVGTSNKNKSIYHPIVYDNLLRDDAKSYLPYAQGSNTEMIDWKFTESLQDFYAFNYKEYTYHFSEKVYEDSPLGRVREVYGPGSDWRSQKASTKFSYLSNIAGNDTLNCLRFEMTEKDNQNMELKVAGNCKSSELSVTRTENEDRQVTLEFKNKFDQVVLSRQIEHNNGSKTNNDTYYLYDEFDNLKAVLPPMVSAQLVSGSSYSSQTSASLAQYAYLYKYDMRNRCIGTKLPGCSWEYKVYDLADRLIFSQTGEQRKRGEWQFALPDAMGRECIMGICKNAIDPFNNPILNTCVKCERTDNASLLGYSVTGVALNSVTVLTAKYYDDYLFKMQNGTLISNSSLNYEANSEFGERYTTSSQGLQTGNATARLDKNGSVTGYDYTATYYDYNGRAIQTKSTNHLGGYEKTYTAYNFTGQPVHTKHIHSKSNSDLIEETKHSYNHAGRLSETVQIVNEKDSTKMSYLYDDLGNIKSLTRIDGTSTLTTTNTYNIRNWLTSIESPLFSQTLHYTDGPGTPQYGGNISSMTWKANKESITRNYQYSYDKLNRLTSANYSEGSNSMTNTNHFNEQVTGYDKHGNITGLKRYGQTGQSSYGLIDDLSLTYTGNQLKKVTDSATSSAYANGFEFKDGVNLDTEYSYDEDGNLTKDLNKNISDIQYNFLNLPRRIQFKDGSEISYLYSADGTKLQTTHIIAGNTTTTDYCGNVIYENGSRDKLLTEQGYFSIADKKFHYYIQDHQGNNRVVASQDGTIEEVNHYYPFGGLFAIYSSAQPYKYNGKELDRKAGLDWYNYGARQYDPVLGRWHTMDLMAEKYYKVSPYVYCLNNPENGSRDKLLTEQGYFSIADKKFHYYIQDHQGNNRVVASQDGTIEEVNHYYPFGGLFAIYSSAQPYKYNGKELDRKAGLDWYNYGARQYDPVLGRWHTMDLMAEKYYKVSPYVYCLNNPILLIDPNGMWPTWGGISRGLSNAFKGTLSFTNGAARAVADNMFLGQTSLRETGIYSNAAAYNAGQNVGDIISIFAGAAEIINGFEEAAGGVALSPETAGISLGVTAKGVYDITHGSLMGTSGFIKLFSKKGRVSEGSSNGSGYSKSSGKNEKHSNMKARDAAKGKMEAAQEKLDAMKKDPKKSRKEIDKVNNEIKHWRNKMDNSGETHHRK